MPIVNGQQAECGCYVEGHWGQYGPDHLADQAEGFGWEPKRRADDPRVLRLIAEHQDERGDNHGYWEWYQGATDKIEEWLNDHTPLVCLQCGRTMEWQDGIYRAVHTHTGRSYCDGLDFPMGKPQRYVWHWADGEFFLSPLCENGDCDDDTCAHWE